MDCDLDTSVPDWIIDHPESAAVFDELRIDASCEGKSLAYVCRQQRFDPNAVLQRLLRVTSSFSTQPSMNMTATSGFA
jgi:iron-sulfur cluster repair protein YtfE (RIC family)